jgi:farnesyl diphosphate synthase
MAHFDNRIEDYVNKIDGYLESILPIKTIPPTDLHEAMHYAVMNGGKRMRPLLVYATGETLGIDSDYLTPPAAAIELLHCFSLVHDDLPSMDDDDLRRGKPSVHVAFSEATAILAADALQALAFHVLATAPIYHDQGDIRIKLITLIAEAAGTTGMTGGQALDLASENQLLDQAQLEHMYRLKTGKLLRACVLSVVYCDHSNNPEQQHALERFIDVMGIAFQIKDDVLDIEGATETLGKPTGSDANKTKATYPGLFGLEQSKQRINTLLEESFALLENFDNRADGLRYLSKMIVKRDM